MVWYSELNWDMVTWSLVFDTPMIQILALYLDFAGEKSIHVLIMIMTN